MFADKKYLRFTVKLIFGLAVFFFIALKVYGIFQENSFEGISLNTKAVPLFLVFLLLMFANWSVEAIKWKRLMATIKPMRFFEALRGVLAGVSTGIVTPNRLGNFIGRSALLAPALRLKATLLTMLANLAQFVVTILFGCIGLMLIGSLFVGNYTILLFAIGVAILLLGFAVYLKPARINRKPFNYFFSDNVVEGIQFISTTPQQLKLEILGWSALRYCIFAIQYVLLLVALNQQQDMLFLFSCVTVVYLLMTLIPSLFFGKLFVREAAALLILSAVGIPDVVILLTGFILWFINIALPSLIGASLLIGKK